MTDLELAADKLAATDYTLIVVKDQEIVAKSKDRGVKGILSLYEDSSHSLTNAAIADKIIGRAVAMICELGTVAECYTPLVSRRAVEILERAEIDYKAEQIVPAIKNRDNTGLCPIEKLTSDLDDSRLAVEKIKEFLNN